MIFGQCLGHADERVTSLAILAAFHGSVLQSSRGVRDTLTRGVAVTVKGVTSG